MKRYRSLILAALLCGSVAFAETVPVESPDGHLKLTFEVAADGAVTHALSLDGKPLISPSPVGFAGGHLAGGGAGHTSIQLRNCG